MSDLSHIDFDALTPAEFEQILPELFQGGEGKVSDDPRLAKFFTANPDALGLVRDLEAIAAAASSLFEDVEPAEESNDSIWSNIAAKLGTEDTGLEDGGLHDLAT